MWGATKAMTRFRHLPDMVRQIVIQVVGARFGAAYELYAHGSVAMASGMSAQLSDEESAGYDTAAALLDRDVLPAPVWDCALAAFGPESAREIVYLVGDYCFVSITLNGFAIPVPDDT
jgi:4-carboxymuconolactone decarboxylase